MSTTAANKTLGIAGGTTGPVMAFSTAWSYSALIVGQDTATGDSAAWSVVGAIRRGPTGNSVPIGTATITKTGADASAATWTLNMVGSSGGHLNFYVNGEAGKTIRWVGTVRVAQVRMPGV